MASYSIAHETINNDQIQEFYNIAKRGFEMDSWDGLDLIFAITLNHRDRFPGISINGQQTPQLYIARWVKSYVDAVSNPPSLRTANPKSACADPAIKVIVKATQDLTEYEATIGETNHNLFMSAENIQGNLLEEYVASKIHSYGFLWCAGNVLRSIDFCNTDGSFFLQVKNKSNTENSSSSNIREGTSIKKWYRLGTRTCNGLKFPDYKWNHLNELINNHKKEGYTLPPCNMSETEYQAFLSQMAGANHGMITNR